jgi:HAD superfamily hydrolase (TIGR01509 family)
MRCRTGTLRAVIFDVDGTLVDSERDGHRVAFNLAFEEAGLPDRWDVATYGELLRVTGGGRRIAHWFEQQGRAPGEAQALAARLHPRKTDLMRDLIAQGRIQARPGVAALIDDLRSRNIAVHVATTGTRAWVDPLLSTVFGDVFDTVVTGTEVTDLKPSPAAYLEVLRITGCAPDRTIAIEDSANGVRAAAAADLRCVAVPNDYTRDDDLSAARIVVDGFGDARLAAWLQPVLPARIPARAMAAKP